MRIAVTLFLLALAGCAHEPCRCVCEVAAAPAVASEPAPGWRTRDYQPVYNSEIVTDTLENRYWTNTPGILDYGTLPPGGCLDIVTGEQVPCKE